MLFGMFEKVARFSLAGVVAFLVSGFGLADVTEFRLIFPHVVRGTAGTYVETLIVITNPGPDPVEVNLESEVFDLDPMSFELAPHESREIRVQGEPLTSGAVSLVATKPVAASALILRKANQESVEVLARALVPASAAVSKAVLPVFVRSPVAEDTGIAIFYVYPGGSVEIRFTLYDSDGQMVATRTERAPFHPNFNFGSAPNQVAFFVTELFPDETADFSEGSLVVEQAVPVQIAESFAILSLYTQGNDFWSALVTPIDDPRAYRVKPKSTEGLDEAAQQLSETYGFVVRFVVNDFISILATKEVARAVARDPAVSEVCPTVPAGIPEG